MEIKNAQNVMFQCNDPAFNFGFFKDEDIKDFHAQPDIIGLDAYDYSFKKSDGDETKLPQLCPASLCISGMNSLEDTENWYRHKYPNLPDEYHGVMARYSTGQLLNSIEFYRTTHWSLWDGLDS